LASSPSPPWLLVEARQASLPLVVASARRQTALKNCEGASTSTGAFLLRASRSLRP
jgi:hypothetical protein